MECVNFKVIISSEFHMRQHRDGDYRDDAPNVTKMSEKMKEMSPQMSKISHEVIISKI